MQTGSDQMANLELMGKLYRHSSDVSSLPLQQDEAAANGVNGVRGNLPSVCLNYFIA